jgi:hypothetical protein
MAKFLDFDFVTEIPPLEEPVLLFGTALGLLDLLEASRARPLPPGSILLETGGYKRAKVSRSREELHAQLAEAFQAPVASEYGMSETFSQGYALGAAPIYTLPPWCRVRLLDPTTLDDAGEGGVGLVALVDLANLDTSIGILTEDLGRAAGENAFEFLGRTSGAEARGCSYVW